MNFQSTTTTSFRAGGTFTIRRLTESLRIKIRTRVADPEERLLDLQAEADELTESYLAKYGATIKVSELSAKERARWTRLNRKMNQIRTHEVDPILVEECLVGLSGITVDDREATAADIKDVDPDLYSQVVTAVRRELGLSADEAENLESPSTSGTVAEGETNGTTVPPAASAATT